MSTNRLRLEDFGDTSRPFRSQAIDTSALEAERLAAFDKGYGAGWDDAMQAAEQDRDQARAAAQARLQDLGFSFHEARAHVMLALTPLLDGIVRSVLPRLVRETLGARIVEELHQMAETVGDAPIDLLVPPGEVEMVTELLAETATLPIEVREEASLDPGQLYLRLGEAEREIDFDGIARALTDAVSALDTINRETLKHA